jgi:hypothetical protein
VWLLVRCLHIVPGLEKPFTGCEQADANLVVEDDVSADALQLLELPVPCDHDDHARFCVDRYATEFLKKVTWLPTGVDVEAATLEAFDKAEALCGVTNQRFRTDEKPSWFSHVQRLVQGILGPLSAGTITSIVERQKHGKGGSVGCSGDGMTASDKYRNTITLTPRLKPFVRALIGEAWYSKLPEPVFHVVRGGTYATVPKKATIRRGIISEPTLTMFGQLGIGSYLTERLARFGVDLHDQTKNQVLAEYAYDWGLATLDLSAASDCVAYEVIRDLVPADWFHLLSLFRSPEIKINGKWRMLEKWSTMGNGYTFPLETVLFKAVVSSVVPRSEWCLTAVYGDDMIVPQKYADTVIERLEYLGFQVNREKSFLAGNFFESCGKDFIRGEPCRPTFAPDEPGPIPKSVQTANGFRIWMRETLGFCPDELRPLWEELVSQTPRPWRGTCVPAEWGDVGIIREAPLGIWCVADPEKDGHGWEGYLAKSVMFVDPPKGPSIFADYEDDFVVLAGLRRIGIPDEEIWTQGRETRKGLYGMPVSRLAFAPRWTRGYHWVE